MLKASLHFLKQETAQHSTRNALRTQRSWQGFVWGSTSETCFVTVSCRENGELEVVDIW